MHVIDHNMYFNISKYNFAITLVEITLVPGIFGACITMHAAL
jgi:hypothetical protein